jgi:ribosomal protein S10
MFYLEIHFKSANYTSILKAKHLFLSLAKKNHQNKPFNAQHQMNTLSKKNQWVGLSNLNTIWVFSKPKGTAQIISTQTKSFFKMSRLGVVQYPECFHTKFLQSLKTNNQMEQNRIYSNRCAASTRMSSCWFNTEAQKHFELGLPKKHKIFTVLRSPFKYKKSQEHFAITYHTHKIVLYTLFSSNIHLLYNLLKLTEMPGVEVQSKTGQLFI